DRGLDDVVHVTGREAIAGGLLAFDFEIDVVPAGDALEEGAPGAGDLLEDLLQLEPDALDGVQVGAHDLHADGGTHSGRDHVDAGPDGEKPGIGEGWDLDGSIYLIGQLLPVDSS